MVIERRINTAEWVSAFGPKRTCVAALHESAIGP